MKRTMPLLSVLFGGAVVATTLGFAPLAKSSGRLFDVTVTNLTGGQVFSPVLLVTHSEGISLFEPGQPASPELAALAEDGDNGPLAALLGTTAGVADVESGTGMIPPGASETIRVRAEGHARRLSMATMLVSTNDTFAALDSIPLDGPPTSLYAIAWDAGSEFDSESCIYIPGPPCGSGGVHDPTPAEGFVHVDGGIHGTGDLDPTVRDWRNPVAKVTIQHARN